MNNESRQNVGLALPLIEIYVAGQYNVVPECCPGSSLDIQQSAVHRVPFNRYYYGRNHLLFTLLLLFICIFMQLMKYKKIEEK